MFPRNRKFLVGIVLVLLIVFGFAFLKRDRSFQALIARRLPAGYPTTLKGVNQWYAAVPAADNAATFYGQAFQKFVQYQTRIENGKQVNIPILAGGRTDPGGNYNDLIWSEFQKHVQTNTAALSLIREASKHSHSRYPLDFEMGFNVTFPHISQLRSLERLLAVRILLLVRDKNTDEAVNSLVDMIRLARSLESEPAFISHLVMQSSFQMSLSAFGAIISKLQLNSRHLDQIEAALENFDRVRSLDRALVFELVGQSELESGPASNLQNIWLNPGSVNSTLNKARTQLYQKSGLMHRDLRWAIARGLDWRELAVTNSPKRFQWMAAYGEKVLQEADKMPLWRPAAKQMVGGIISPGSAEKQAVFDTLVLQFRTAIAVERFRLKHGALPGRLEDLVPGFLPAVPLDPFSGASLRYVKLEPGYVLYAIGSDLKDDQGLPRNPKQGPRYDIPFKVSR